MGKQRIVYSSDPNRFVIATDAVHENFVPVSRFLHNVVMDLKPSSIEYGLEGTATMEALGYKMTAGTARAYAEGAVLIPMSFQRVAVVIAGGNEETYRPIISARVTFIETPGKVSNTLEAVLKANSIGPEKDGENDSLTDYRRAIEFRLCHRWLFEALLDCERATTKVRVILDSLAQHHPFRLNDLDYREAIGHILYCPQDSCKKYKEAYTETLNRHYWILVNQVRIEFFL